MNTKTKKALALIFIIGGLAAIPFLEWPKDDSDSELETMIGKSDAFDINPRPYINIKADKGAFKENVDIKVTDVPGEQMEELEKKLKEQNGLRLIDAYDIDAGLEPDEVIPGSYQVSFDLDKLEIPASLHSSMIVVRQSADGRLELMNSHVKDGKLTYVTSQNSIIALCAYGALFATPFIISGSLFIRYLPMTLYNIDQTKDFFIRTFDGTHSANKSQDLEAIYVVTPHTNFNLWFRYSKTENADDLKVYRAAVTKLNKRVSELEKQADKEFSSWSIKTWFSKDAKREQEKKKAEYLDQLLKNDKQAQELTKDRDAKFPQSIQDIINGILLAEEFHNEENAMKPVEKIFDVYVSHKPLPGNVLGLSLGWDRLSPYLALDYTKIMEEEPGNAYEDRFLGPTYKYNKKAYDSMLLTISHELFHLHQYEYLFSNFFKDDSFIEALACIEEYQFAQWLVHEKHIKYDPFDKQGMERMGFTPRQYKQFLGWTLTKKIPKVSDIPNTSIEAGYMLADLVQYLLDHQYDRTLHYIMSNYEYKKSLADNLMKIFDAKPDQFRKLYEGFCQEYIKEIVHMQGTAKSDDYARIVIGEQKHSKESPICRLKDFGHTASKAYPFAVKTTTLYSTVDKDSRAKSRYSLFAIPSKAIANNELGFEFINEKNKFVRYKKDQADNISARKLSFNPCSKGFEHSAQCALFFRPGIEKLTINDDVYIDVVALYEIGSEPKILGRSEDDKGLVIETGYVFPKALAEHGYVTGMAFTVTDNKTKKTKTAEVPISQFPSNETQKKIEIAYSKLGISNIDDIDITVKSCWYYRTDDKKVYTSPYSKEVPFKDKRAGGILMKDSYPWGKGNIDVTIYSDGRFVVDIPEREENHVGTGVEFVHGTGLKSKMYSTDSKTVHSSFRLEGKGEVKKKTYDSDSWLPWEISIENFEIRSSEYSEKEVAWYKGVNSNTRLGQYYEKNLKYKVDSKSSDRAKTDHSTTPYFHVTPTKLQLRFVSKCLGGTLNNHLEEKNETVTPYTFIDVYESDKEQ